MKLKRKLCTKWGFYSSIVCWYHQGVCGSPVTLINDLDNLLDAVASHSWLLESGVRLYVLSISCSGIQVCYSVRKCYKSSWTWEGVGSLRNRHSTGEQSDAYAWLFDQNSYSRRSKIIEFFLFNTKRTDGVIFDPWDTLGVHIFGTACNKILKFYDFS